MPYETLNVIREELKEIRELLKVETGNREQAFRHERTRRRRWMVIVACVVLLGLAGVWENRGRVNDFDQALDRIQASRIETCRELQDSADALVERDEDIIELAVEFADESPTVAQQIIDRLDVAPSAEALEPVNCEEVILGE